MQTIESVNTVSTVLGRWRIDSRSKAMQSNDGNRLRLLLESSVGQYGQIFLQTRVNGVGARVTFASVWLNILPLNELLCGNLS